MKQNLVLITFLLFVTLASCEGENGISGVVVDSETYERLENVSVRMETDNGAVEETETDSIGYFEAIVFVGCGLNGNNCTDFTAEFKMEGYQDLIISEDYYRDSDTEFINDTLVIKLYRNEQNHYLQQNNRH